jgi:hypothetical protein
VREKRDRGGMSNRSRKQPASASHRTKAHASPASPVFNAHGGAVAGLHIFQLCQEAHSAVDTGQCRVSHLSYVLAFCSLPASYPLLQPVGQRHNGGARGCPPPVSLLTENPPTVLLCSGSVVRGASWPWTGMSNPASATPLQSDHTGQVYSYCY